MSGEKIFYQNRKITTVKTDKRSCSIFRSPQFALAERLSDSAESCNLLTVDIKGSVLAANDITPLESYNYSPYGNAIAIPSPRSLLAFNGERAERSGLYILGSYRAYSVVLMRFLSPDILSPFGKGWINPYTYCAGDPINYTDPTGHMRKAPRTPSENFSRYNKKLENLEKELTNKNNTIDNLKEQYNKAPQHMRKRERLYAHMGKNRPKTKLSQMEHMIEKIDEDIHKLIGKYEKTLKKLESTADLLEAEERSTTPHAPSPRLFIDYEAIARTHSTKPNYLPAAPDLRLLMEDVRIRQLGPSKNWSYPKSTQF